MGSSRNTRFGSGFAMKGFFGQNIYGYRFMVRRSQVPRALVGLRLAIAPLLLWDAANKSTTTWFMIGYVIAVLSDIFDGIIARRLGVSTPQLRQWDSWADISLYGCIAISVGWVHPDVIQRFQGPLLLAIAAQLGLFATSLIKFKQMPSFHTYTAKVWGLTLFAATVALFGFGEDRWLWLAIALCLVNSLEEIAITLLLPEWQCDVLSVVHAWQLRSMKNTSHSQ